MNRTVRISRTRSSGTVTTSLLILPLALAISTGPDRVNAQSRGDRAHPRADPALEDYASTEKISDLPKRLTTEGAPPGFAPSVGDITYYAPWGNLAIFHKDFRYSSGLVSLGTLDSGLSRLARSGPVRVTFELAHRR